MVEGFELEAWNRSPLSNLDVVTLVLPYRDALVNEIVDIEKYLFCLFPIFVHLLFETLDLSWNRLGLFHELGGILSLLPRLGYRRCDLIPSPSEPFDFCQASPPVPVQPNELVYILNLLRHTTVSQVLLHAIGSLTDQSDLQHRGSIRSAMYRGRRKGFSKNHRVKRRQPFSRPGNIALFR